MGAYPQSAVLRNNLAVLLELRGDLEAAEHQLTEARRDEPSLPQASKNLGDLAYRRGRYDDAWEHYRRAAQLLPDLGDDVYFKLGCIKREQGQAKQAISNFEKALGVDASHRPTLDALVSLFAEQRDWKQVVHYKRAMLDNVFEGPERFKILGEIGDVWADNDKNPHKAIEAFDMQLEKYPENANKNADALFMKGRSLMQLGRRSDAATEYRTLIQKYPRSEPADKARAELKNMGLSATPAPATTRKKR